MKVAKIEQQRMSSEDHAGKRSRNRDNGCDAPSAVLAG
jgi:hypothetical protein